MSGTIADGLRDDPRVGRAKALVLEALEDHRSRIKGVRPPLSECAASYSALLDEAARLRGRPLYFPYIGSGIGRGALVELGDGSVKYDFISGIGVHVLGHSHPLLVEAALDAALSDIVMQGHLQQNEETGAVSRLLLDGANLGGARLAHSFLTTSGAMANENALKILFQKKHPARRLLAFEGCFAGRSLVLSHVTAQDDCREGLPRFVEVDRVPFFEVADPTGSVDRALHALDKHLAQHPDDHAAMVFELVQGERGAYAGDAAFFRALMTRLREHEVPILIDEVQTFGRTTELFAFQHFGLHEFADVVTVGKMLQICATLFRAEFNPKPGLLSQTFIGSTASLHAARAILRELGAGGYFGPRGKVRQLGEAMAGRLQALAARSGGVIAGPFGLGALIGFTPFDGSAERAGALVHALFNAGVIGFVAGRQPSRIRFLLPYPVIDEHDLDAVIAILDETLRACR